MSAEKNDCRTVLLDDVPATKDAFGPHKRIADAVVSLVKSEPGGRAVGIEGGWGSGKSTVITFVRNSLRSDSNYRVITFDAWAHEGDPLRRTYLEGIISDLIEGGWIASEKWNKTLEELAKRLKSTTTRITPKPTWLGGIFAVSLVFVPIGTTLVTSAFRQGGDATVADLSTWPWIAYVGSVVALTPLWVLALNGVRIFLREAWRWLRSTTPWPSRQVPPASDWSFLLSKAIEETRTDTTETPNPTSIEFEAHFTRAMKEALGQDQKRSLVLVLDNLDRVDTNSAISVWSTLQTFLQERNSLNSSWFKQIWVVVPYDPIGLRKLWDNWRVTSVGETEDGRTRATSSQEHQVASHSFIDKSFQIRFQVPPPVLSDWKTYLYELIATALPDHDEADRHAIYRVCEEWRSARSMPPTPRELKLYVNQIGAIHRQWQHEFPITHVAYYVLCSRESDSLIDQLKARDFPPTNIKRLFREDIVPSLAGLTFNVPAHKGMELLLSGPIYNCLTSESGKELTQLSENYRDGFWAVLEGVVATRISDASGPVVARACRVMCDAGLLDDESPLEVRAIRVLLKDAIVSVQDWRLLDNEAAEGIGVILRLFNDRELSGSILRSVATSVSQANVVDKQQDMANLPGALLNVLRNATDLGFEDVIPQSIIIPGDVEVWMATCESLSAEPSDERYFKLFKTEEEANAITSAIEAAVRAGEFGERHIATLRVTTKSAARSDWSSIAGAIQTRLDAGVGASADEMRQLLRGLWALRNLGDRKSSKAIKALVAGGHIAHHLHQSSKHREGGALCQFTMLHEDPVAAAPPAVGNSASGHQLLINALAASDKELAKAFCDTVEKHSNISKLFDLIDARGACDPLLATCLRSIAEGDAPHKLYSNKTILSRWTQILDALSTEEDDGLFDRLIGKLADEYGLCDAIQSSSKGFSTVDAVLYWTIVRSSKVADPGFYTWSRDGLEKLGKDEWVVDLGATCECVWLACLLIDKGVRPKLTTHLSDALVEHAAEVVKGQQIPEGVVLERWQDIASLLEESTRKALRSRLLGLAIGADGHLSREFLAMYGSEIARPEVLTTNDRSIEGLFSPIVRGRNVSGATWLKEFFQGNAGFLDALSSSFNSAEFRTRLQDCVDDPKTDDAQPVIEELAKMLGIEAQQPAEEAGSATPD